MARRARFPNSRSHFLTKRAGRFHLPWLQRAPRGGVKSRPHLYECPRRPPECARMARRPCQARSTHQTGIATIYRRGISHCGAPVTASATSSLPEAVGKMGRLIDPLDVDAWTAELLRAAIDMNYRDDDASAARRAFALSFTWRRAAKETISTPSASAHRRYRSGGMRPRLVSSCEMKV